LLLLFVGWVLALAGAICRSLGRLRLLQGPARLAGPFHGLALLLVGLGILAGGLPGWAAWSEVIRPRLVAFAAISAVLLAGVMHRPADRKGIAWAGDAGLAWLAVIAGAWSIVGMLTAS